MAQKKIREFLERLPGLCVISAAPKRGTVSLAPDPDPAVPPQAPVLPTAPALCFCARAGLFRRTIIFAAMAQRPRWNRTVQIKFAPVFLGLSDTADRYVNVTRRGLEY